MTATEELKDSPKVGKGPIWWVKGSAWFRSQRTRLARRLFSLTSVAVAFLLAGVAVLLGWPVVGGENIMVGIGLLLCGVALIPLDLAYQPSRRTLLGVAYQPLRRTLIGVAFLLLTAGVVLVGVANLRAGDTPAGVAFFVVAVLYLLIGFAVRPFRHALRDVSLPVAVSVSVVLLLVLALGVLYLTRRPWLTGWTWDLGSEDMPWKDRLTYAAAVAAAVGAVIALVVSYRKQRDAEEGRFATLFAEAAAQLGNTSPAVRIAGVYALAALADRYKTRRQQVIDALCGYLRLPYDPEAGRGHITSRTSETTVRQTRKPAKVTTTETYRPEDRQVRLTIISVIREHLLYPTEATTWCGHTLDFTGATFDYGYLSHATFTGRVSFIDATFTGPVSFMEATFTRDAKLFFTEATFTGDAELLFTGAKLTGAQVSFDLTKFSGDAKVLFTEAKLTGAQMSFYRAAFADDARASFDDAELTGVQVSFDRARFTDDTRASFDRMRLSNGQLSFDEARFGDHTWASFDEATFADDARASFNRAKFADDARASFNRARLSSGQMSFDRARFGDGVAVSFKDGDISDAMVITRDGTPFKGWPGCRHISVNPPRLPGSTESDRTGRTPWSHLRLRAPRGWVARLLRPRRGRRPLATVKRLPGRCQEGIKRAWKRGKGGAGPAATRRHHRRAAAP